MSKNRN